MTTIVLSDRPEDGSVGLRDLGLRRCRGCVKCLTENPGTCVIADGLSDMMPRILSADRLVIRFSPISGRVPADIMKAVERISNILEVYTDSGGNIPRPIEGTNLRTVEFDVVGDIVSGPFETEMESNIRKGPVTNVEFRYF